MSEGERAPHSNQLRPNRGGLKLSDRMGCALHSNFTHARPALVIGRPFRLKISSLAKGFVKIEGLVFIAVSLVHSEDFQT